MKSRTISYALVVLVFVLAPLLVGQSVLGLQSKSGRSSISSSAHGHKAFSLLLEKLGHRVGRFQSSAEAAPEAPGVLIALEPGSLLFRNHGLYAQGLRAWIEQGNAALITLGIDPDEAAEQDDAQNKSSAWVKRVKRGLAIFDRFGSDSKARKESPDPSDSNSPVFFEAKAKLVLQRSSKRMKRSWPLRDLSAWLNVSLQEDRLDHQSIDGACPIKSALNSRLELGPNPQLKLTRARMLQLAADSKFGRVLIWACEKALVLEFRLGKGLVYVLSEPRLLHNAKIGEASHAALGANLVNQLAQHLGHGRVYFEEFSHGRSQARTLFDLITRDQGRLVLFQVLLLAFLWLWFRMSRRCNPVPRPSLARNASEDMMAALARLYAASKENVKHRP